MLYDLETEQLVNATGPLLTGQEDRQTLLHNGVYILKGRVDEFVEAGRLIRLTVSEPQPEHAVKDGALGWAIDVDKKTATRTVDGVPWSEAIDPDQQLAIQSRAAMDALERASYERGVLWTLPDGSTLNGEDASGQQVTLSFVPNGTTNTDWERYGVKMASRDPHAVEKFDAREGRCAIPGEAIRALLRWMAERASEAESFKNDLESLYRRSEHATVMQMISAVMSQATTPVDDEPDEEDEPQETLASLAAEEPSQGSFTLPAQVIERHDLRGVYWTPVPGAVKYEISWSTDGGDTWEKPYIEIAENFYEVQGELSGEIRYGIRAINSAGEKTQWSDDVTEIE